MNQKGAKENLREFYITPLYLSTMQERARGWSENFLKDQERLFRENHPDYPELVGLIESELHRRKLNSFRQKVKNSRDHDLHKLLKELEEEDFQEMVRVELEIRTGVSRLTDPEDD